MVSFDGYAESVDDQMRTLEHHLTSHRDADEIICAAISHPKNMGDYSLAMMRAFVERVRLRYGRRVEFCTYRQIAKSLMAPRR